VSLAPKILVEDAGIDWTEPAGAVDRRIRACTPGPGAWTTFEGERFKVGPVLIEANVPALEPGVLDVTKNAVVVGTGSLPVRLGEVKPFGRKQMQAADWARGARVEPGARFGTHGG
jgi:methionyl-tRNA formyltransferase